MPFYHYDKKPIVFQDILFGYLRYDDHDSFENSILMFSFPDYIQFNLSFITFIQFPVYLHYFINLKTIHFFFFCNTIIT